ncbi:MAG: TolC family protein, partial [Limnobacter sp.]|nr:TolC family protein [Limnobacter sp.]
MLKIGKSKEVGLKITVSLVLLVVLGLSAPRIHAEPQAGVISQLYERAKRHDPVFRGNVSATMARKQALNQGRAALLPQLNASALWQQVDAERSAFGQSASSNSTPFGYTVTLNQPLFRMQSWENFKQAELVFGLAEVQTQLAEQDLMLRVVQA